MTASQLHPVPVRYDRQLGPDEIAQGYHRDFVGGHWEELGQLQLSFLLSRGLKAEHKLLDVGCGCLRGGLPIIRYLERSRYAGIDQNASLIEAAQHELGLAGLDARCPRLLLDGSFRVERFGMRFDYALAHSLFTHLPAPLIELCLQRVADVLEPGGLFYASYFPVADDHAGGPVSRVDGIVTHDDEDPFHQPAALYARLIETLPLTLTNVGDWGHRRGQHMLEFRKQANSSSASTPTS